MAHLSGGAEAHARFKYRANSSLVLRPRDTHEPTGEPESLWGKIDPKSFGDRAACGTPQDKLDKSHANKSKKSSIRKRKRKRALELDKSHANKSKKSSTGKRKRALDTNKSKKSSTGKRKRALEPCNNKKNQNNNHYKKSKTQQQERDWAEIPTDALSVIFLKLGAFEVLVSAQMVCRPWRELSLDPTQQFWRTIDIRRLTPSIMYGLNQEELAIAAVERSGGNIEELHVMFVSDRFITFMSNRNDRTSKLRCCALIMSFHLTPQLLADFLCQCPLLEELHIYRCLLTPETYGAVGRACPRVKSLWVDGKYKSDSDSDNDSEAEYDLLKAETFLNNNFTSFPRQPDVNSEPVESDSESETDLSLDDKVAVEIAKTMPQLRELQLIKNFELTKRGLYCILDKCLHLQFLDIRRSFDVRIDNTLQAKLDKIKFVRLSRRSRISLAEEAARGETIDTGKAVRQLPS